MSLQISPFTQLAFEALSEQQFDVLKPVIEMLNSSTIDREFLMKYLRLDVFEGAPLLREYVWKVILGYLPTERSKWEAEANKQETYYRDYLLQFLSQEIQSSDMKQHEKDCNLWAKIEKDTYRTQPDLPFFKEPAKPLQLCLDSWQEEKVTRRYNYMSRILFIFAKLNPLVDYVQGMNEILAPIFYVVNHSCSEDIQEAACFFMFANVMTDIISFHIRDYDNSENVFHERMAKISSMLITVDLATWQRLELLEVDPFLYLFRWVTLLFAQEFPMCQTLRVWESIFSYKDRAPFVDAFALALIMSAKEKIAVGSFSEVLQHLRCISSHVKLEEVLIEARQYCESDPQRWTTSAYDSSEEKESEAGEEERSWMPGFFKQFL